MSEENIKLYLFPNVFFNKEMRFCRSFSSLGVGSIQTTINVCDAFCASGVRGIRYANENKNVEEVTLVDVDDDAIRCAEDNASRNGIKFSSFPGSFYEFSLENNDIDLLEIDPFGSPSPYLFPAFYSLRKKKQAYLSITATDCAVLCGVHAQACMNNYHAKPGRVPFCHETGIRILLKKIAEVGTEFNFGVEPLFSLSANHYFKVFLKISRSSVATSKSRKKLGYVFYCYGCGQIKHSQQFDNVDFICQSCNKRFEWIGPLWIGEIHNMPFLMRMFELNKEREYSDKKRISNTLSFMIGEIELPPFYYDLHKFVKLYKKHPPKMAEVIKKISDAGYICRRTHFSQHGIKTNAPFEFFKQKILSFQEDGEDHSVDK